MEELVALSLGIGLAAAVGLRIFVPPLLVGVAAANGWFDPPAAAEWLGHPVAVMAFGIAVALELLAYAIPWLDNLLDTLAAPIAVVAGTLLAAAFFSDMPPALRWTLAIIAGGGASATTQGLTTAVRAGSTATTGGLANPAVSAFEAAASTMLTLITLLLPLFVAVVILGLAVALLWRWRRGPKTGSTAPTA